MRRRAPVADFVPDVTTLDAQGLTCVDAYAHSYDIVLRLLNCSGSRHRCVRVGERGGELVTTAVDLLTARCRERRAYGPTVFLQRSGVAVTQFLHEPRRSLDVREQEGDAHAPTLPPISAEFRARASPHRPVESAVRWSSAQMSWTTFLESA